MHAVQYGRQAAPRSSRDEQNGRLVRYISRADGAALTPDAFTLAIQMARAAEPDGRLRLTYPQLLATTRIHSRTTLNTALAALVTANLIRATGNHRNRVYHVQWTTGRLNLVAGVQ